ncbi:hypothetical protein [Pseudodonghicola xiamenensis]|nr:hypothetical protein [Pseudodonghicola xiamenensis]
MMITSTCSSRHSTQFTGGQDASRAAEKLEAAGYLEPGGERNSRQFALSGVRKQRIRVYRIRAEILSA